jgi:hypothetical protein
MAYRLATPEGKKLYRLRKQMPEPVFGIIKSVLGFRQSLTRIAVATPWHWNQRGLGYPRRLTRLPDAATSA